MELEVEDVGPALRFATAKVNRVQRQGGGFGEGGSGAGAGSFSSAPTDDPWASGAAGGAPAYDEPPF